MAKLLEALRAKGTLLSDGGWGSMLILEGLRVGDCPEHWNVERPEAVRGVARAYVEAGPDLISTNSFGGNRFRLAAYGLGDRVEELNETAAAISREAAGGNVLVCGSIGPTGIFLIEGEVSEAELYEAFRVQAAALARGGVDAILVETMAAIDEACAAIRAAKDATGLEVLCTFTFNRSANGAFHTLMGVTPEQMAEAVAAAGADVIGTNCTQGPEGMVELAAKMAAASDRPILVQPNAGQPVVVGEKTLYPETPEAFAAWLPALRHAGARIVGGCCGTTPKHIKALRKAITH